MEHFNKLTPAEAERLFILLEECGEVVQIVGKILRHGYESYNPFDSSKTTNRLWLETELGDIQYIVGKMEENNDVSGQHINDASVIKEKKVTKYLHHQEV